MSIILHNNQNVIKEGGRKIARMSQKEFENKIKAFVDDYISRNRVDNLYDLLFDYIYSGKGVTETLYKDFKGFIYSGSYIDRTYWSGPRFVTVKNEMQFDNENVMLSLEEIDGCPYILVSSCGGDWQYGFCFLLYHDGKKFRAFVPTYGNVWIPFVKNEVKCKGLIGGDYDYVDGYEYNGKPDWKFILKAMGNEYDDRIIENTVDDVSARPDDILPEYFIQDYGFDPSELSNIDDLQSYITNKAQTLLNDLRKNNVSEDLSPIDNMFLIHLKSSIFEVLNVETEETDVDCCVEEFESRVEPYDL